MNLGRPALARRAAIDQPHPSTILLRLSLLLGALAGFSLGLALLLGEVTGLTTLIPWVALTQVHGQIQLIGFVGLFILGTAAQLLPGFLSRPLSPALRTRLIWGGYVVAASLLMRAIAQPISPSPFRSGVLWLAAVGEVVGIGLGVTSYAALARQSIQPAEVWRTLVAIGFGFLIASVGLNLIATTTLTAGLTIVPVALDSAVVKVELWGFVILIAYGVSRKILPRFLLLPPPNDQLIRIGALSYASGVVVISIGWLFQTIPQLQRLGLDARALGTWPQLLGVVLYLIGLRLYQKPVRPSGAPNVTDPARRWLRIAFAWLLLASGLAALWGIRWLLGGAEASFFELTAQRHALAQGFILSILVAYGARILPGFSAWAIRHPNVIEWIFGCITAGAGLRVIGELGTPMLGEPAEIVAALGGTLGVIGFLAFAFFLARALGQAPTPANGRSRPST